MATGTSLGRRTLARLPANGTVLLPNVEGMSEAPTSATEAVNLLLETCPELEPAWRDLCRWMGESTGDGVGIYNVFVQIIVPFLTYAIGSPARRLQDQSEWADIPSQGSDQLTDLLRRLFEQLDLWAQSSDSDLREAVWMELKEGDYEDLAVGDIIAIAGPALKAL